MVLYFLSKHFQDNIPFEFFHKAITIYKNILFQFLLFPVLEMNFFYHIIVIFYLAQFLQCSSIQHLDLIQSVIERQHKKNVKPLAKVAANQNIQHEDDDEINIDEESPTDNEMISHDQTNVIINTTDETADHVLVKPILFNYFKC